MGLNFSRALLNLGDGLGQIAQTVAQRERDSMMAAREENLMRLNATLRQQADDRQFGQQKELLGIEDTMRGAAETRRQGFESSQLNTRMAHENQLATQDDKLRRDLAGAEAGLTRERLSREEKMQNERYTREDMNLLERQYASQINQIDDRLARINDEMTKQKASASTAGMELDPKLLEPWQGEIQELQRQKKLLGKERDVALSQFANGRVKKLTPEEVEEERRIAQGGTPAGGPRRGGDRETPAKPGVAAQARAPGGVPAMPAKPQGMIDRAQRKKGGALSKIARTVADELGSEKATERREEEAKRFRGVADKVTGAISGAKKETAVATEAKKALRSGGAVTPEQSAQLKRMGAAQLKRVYGFTDRDLAQLGL